MSPRARPERTFFKLPEGRISGLRFGRAEMPLKIVFLHATGFNGLVYRSVLEPLGLHALALDMRGHGMSELPIFPEKIRNWLFARDDVVSFLDRYIETPVILAGHSWGGVVSTLAAAKRSGKVSGLVALDPVSIPLLMRLPAYIPGGRTLLKKRLPLAYNAGKRRFLFPNLEYVFERYKNRGTFRGFSDQIIRDYLEGGLKPHPEGVQLACNPEWEQALYVAQGHNIYRAAKTYARFGRPVKMIYAKRDGPSTSGTRAQMRRAIGRENVKYREDLGHMFPMQNPDIATGYLRRMLETVAPR